MVDETEGRFGSLQDQMCREILAMATDAGYVYARDIRFEMDLDSAEVTAAMSALADDGLIELIGMKNAQAAALTTRGQWVARNHLDIPMIKGESKS